MNYLRDTTYITDEYGHICLDDYGKRLKEACHYSPEHKYIAMHANMTNAEYTDVIQHELGHFIDDILGSPSTGTAFRQAFIAAEKTYHSDTAQGRMMLIDMLDDAFSTGAAFDRNVADIISAVTSNNPIVVQKFQNEGVAFYHHKNQYWNRLSENGFGAGMREKEFFANIFAIKTGNYRISVNFTERWFPQLCTAFEQSIRRT